MLLLGESCNQNLREQETNGDSNTFMLGIGGLATVWLSAYFGRLPVLFWFGCLSAGTAAWSAAAQSFESYMAARILNGLFAVAGAGGGLMWIQDIFFFHSWPKRINIWSTAIILSPFLGPQFMAAIISVDSWRSGMWLNFGIITFGLALTAILGDETFYPRHLPKEQVPRRQNRLLRVVGIEQARQHYTTNTFLGAGSRLGYVIMKLPVFLVCLFYFFDCKLPLVKGSGDQALMTFSPMDDWQQHHNLCPDRSCLQLRLPKFSCYLHSPSCWRHSRSCVWSFSL